MSRAHPSTTAPLGLSADSARARRSRAATRVLSLLIAVAYWGGTSIYDGLRRVTSGTRPTTPLVVLTYHAVAKEDVGQFEKQMVELKRRAKPVFADDPLTSSRRRAAVTFDDAFQCTFDHALPVLARHEIPATVFVPTGFLGAPAGWMVTRGGADDVADHVVARATLADLDPRRVRLGSHTVTHPRLASLDTAAVQAELSASRRTLENISGAPVRMLALPYGSSSANVLATAARMGYARVFANVPAPGDRGGAPLLVGRIDVSPRDWPLEFRLKVQGAYQWLTLAIPAKRALLRLLGRRRES